MRSLAAAISPGYFGFTDWAFAAEAASEIAMQVPIATRKNNALISFPPTFVHSRGSIRSASCAGLVQIKTIETSSRFRACAAVRSLLSVRAYGQARIGVHGFSNISLADRGSIGNTFSVFVSYPLRILLTVC